MCAVVVGGGDVVALQQAIINVLCDPRLKNKGYGRTFLRALPAMPETRELAAVAAFFAADSFESLPNAPDCGGCPNCPNCPGPGGGR